MVWRALVLILISCLASSSAPTGKVYEVVGTWSLLEDPKRQDEIVCVRSSFAKDRLGFKFKRSGQLIVRSYTSWCATGPDLVNYKGSWKMTSDSTIQLTHENWNGVLDYNLEIVELTGRILRMRVVVL